VRALLGENGEAEVEAREAVREQLPQIGGRYWRWDWTETFRQEAIILREYEVTRFFILDGDTRCVELRDCLPGERLGMLMSPEFLSPSPQEALEGARRVFARQEARHTASEERRALLRKLRAYAEELIRWYDELDETGQGRLHP
jgi:hypothetical protein